MATETIHVPEIHCGHCVASITGALAPMDGVSSVDVRLDERVVVVDLDGPATRQSVVDAIEDQGYEVTDGPADDAPADTLPMA